MLQYPTQWLRSSDRCYNSPRCGCSNPRSGCIDQKEAAVAHMAAATAHKEAIIDHTKTVISRAVAATDHAHPFEPVMMAYEKVRSIFTKKA